MPPVLIASQIITGIKNFASSKFGKWAIIIVVIIVLMLVTTSASAKGFKKFKRKKDEKKFDAEEEKLVNQLAVQYRIASNPSGEKVLIDYDGTNDSIYEDQGKVKSLAKQTKGRFKEVAEKYKLKFHETLTDRMTNELDSEEYAKWNNTIFS